MPDKTLFSALIDLLEQVTPEESEELRAAIWKLLCGSRNSQFTTVIRATPSVKLMPCITVGPKIECDLENGKTWCE